ARERVGRPLDQPEELGTRAEDGRQKDGEKRKDHLRADVGEEAREPERDDCTGKASSSAVWDGQPGRARRRPRRCFLLITHPGTRGASSSSAEIGTPCVS